MPQAATSAVRNAPKSTAQRVPERARASRTTVHPAATSAAPIQRSRTAIGKRLEVAVNSGCSAAYQPRE